MFDDSIFKLIFEIFHSLLCEALPQRIASKKHSVLSKIIAVLIVLLEIILILAILIIIGVILFFVVKNIDNIFLAIILIVLSLSALVGIIMLLAKTSEYLSAEKKMKYLKEDKNNKRHMK